MYCGLHVLFVFVLTVKSPSVPLRQNSVPNDLQTSQHNTVLSTVQHEMAVRRQQKNGNGVLSRQDSRLSVRSLIESIESAAKQAKQQQQANGGVSLPTTPTSGNQCSRSSSSSSLNSLAASGVASSVATPNSPASPQGNNRDWTEAIGISRPLREQQPTAITRTTNKNIISGKH